MGGGGNLEKEGPGEDKGNILGRQYSVELTGVLMKFELRTRKAQGYMYVLEMRG